MQRNRPPVCRCLFGPPDPDEDRFTQETEEMLQRLDDEAARRWDFDFRAGRPLTDVDESSRRYEWTLVDNCESVPSFYNKMLKRTEKVESKLAEVSRHSRDVTESASGVVTSDATFNIITAVDSSEAVTAATMSPDASASGYTPAANCESPDSVNRCVD